MTKGIPNPPKTPNRPQGPQPAGSMRPAKCELSPSLHNRIVAARKAGKTYPQKQEQEKENGKTISWTTLQTTVKKDYGNTSGVSKARRGRPQKISDEVKKKIWEEIKKTSEWTMKDLHVNLCPFVSEKTFKNTVREGHKRKWKNKKAASSSSCPCSCTPKMCILI